MKKVSSARFSYHTCCVPPNRVSIFASMEKMDSCITRYAPPPPFAKCSRSCGADKVVFPLHDAQPPKDTTFQNDEWERDGRWRVCCGFESGGVGGVYVDGDGLTCDEIDWGPASKVMWASSLRWSMLVWNSYCFLSYPGTCVGGSSWRWIREDQDTKVNVAGFGMTTGRLYTTMTLWRGIVWQPTFIFRRHEVVELWWLQSPRACE